MKSREQFISTYAPYAVLTDTIYGVPASISLAQAALESGYGDSKLAKEGNNLFGIKAGSDQSGKSFLTTEYDKEYDDWKGVNAEFRTYDSKWGSFLDHGEFLSKDRWNEVKKASPERGTMILQTRGYATDPDYANKLRGIIDDHDLERFDKYSIIIRSLVFIGIAMGL